MILCPKCGNKRCPHANSHENQCSGSNEPGQVGGPDSQEWQSPEQANRFHADDAVRDTKPDASAPEHHGAENCSTVTKPNWAALIPFCAWTLLVGAIYLAGEGEPLLVIVTILWAMLAEFGQEISTTSKQAP